MDIETIDEQEDVFIIANNEEDRYTKEVKLAGIALGICIIVYNLTVLFVAYPVHSIIES